MKYERVERRVSPRVRLARFLKSKPPGMSSSWGYWLLFLGYGAAIVAVFWFGSDLIARTLIGIP